MSRLPRRTLDEIKTRYFLESNLCDIYVEGEFDKKAIESWCGKNNEKKIISYTIDSVELPISILQKHGLTEGNKQRVIALAKELSISESGNYKLLVDKDLDHWFSGIDDIPNLLWTDYSSLEMYFFTEEIIRSIIVDISNCKIDDWEVFYNSFILVLKELYSIQLACRELDIKTSWCEIRKSLSIINGELKFDIQGYIIKNYNAENFGLTRENFLVAQDMWLSKLNCDNRLCIRGHDFVDLMALSVKLYKGNNKFNDSNVLQPILLAYIHEIDELAQRMR
ncbi:DUF4435 domain-containing protein [Providencia sp. PROV196]|uniref:DUF4435 domain-containing protein n=1 Tax=Providencia sp. PROV196 TaxID=2949897 RepID=UPI002349BAFA|nr:DUF4435 domain-containing protein [Providencia sp. PROV196]